MMNQLLKGSLFTLMLVSLFACEEPQEEEIDPETIEGEAETQRLLKKDIWSPSDYMTVIYYIDKTKDIEDYPNFKNSKNSATLKKLLDTENFKVTLSDENLSLKQKSEMSEDYFYSAKRLIDLYDTVGIKGKYIYDEELVEVLVFTNILCIAEIKAMNAYITDISDDVDEFRIASRIKTNENICHRNFRSYLRYAQDAYLMGESGVKRFAKGIDILFPLLLEAFPDADYSFAKRIATRRANEAQDDELRAALERLVELLESK